MAVPQDRLAEARVHTLRRRPRPHRDARALEDTIFVHSRGRVPLAVLVNHLTVAPIATDTGLSLPWTSTVAQRFACDCVDHVLEQLGESGGDARVRACVDVARRYALGEADGDTLETARLAALDATRVGSVVAARVADAAAAAARPASHEGWPADVLWACRRAVGAAAVEALSSARSAAANEPTLVVMARAELENEVVRRRAEMREHDWQCRHLVVALEAARAPSLTGA